MTSRQLLPQLSLAIGLEIILLVIFSAIPLVHSELSTVTVGGNSSLLVECSGFENFWYFIWFIIQALYLLIFISAALVIAFLLRGRLHFV